MINAGRARQERNVEIIDVRGRTRRKRRAAVLTVEQRYGWEQRELAAGIQAACAIQAEWCMPATGR
jgi:hypothetical protein